MWNIRHLVRVGLQPSGGQGGQLGAVLALFALLPLLNPPFIPPFLPPCLLSSTLSAAGRDCTDQSMHRTNRRPSHPARGLH